MNKFQLVISSINLILGVFVLQQYAYNADHRFLAVGIVACFSSGAGLSSVLRHVL